ncbi:MAG: hypothetical protein RLP44_21175 [Aggregatilineales bacterium]
METIKIQGISDADNIIKLEIPVPSARQAYELIIVLQPVEQPALDAMGYPIGYFEETYGSFRDAPLERGIDLPFETRESLE